MMYCFNAAEVFQLALEIKENGRSFYEQAQNKIQDPEIKKDEGTMVSVDVTNTGKRAGHEVVQMYIRDCFSSVTRPVKELKGFGRVFLEPGQTETITLEITPELLSFYDMDMKYTVEPGEFVIMVGSSSRDEDLLRAVLIVNN